MDAEPALIGREQELAALDAALTSRGPAFLVLAGEAGMGRSSLVRVARERARSGGWRCIPDAEEAIDVGEGFIATVLEQELKHSVGLGSGDDHRLLEQVVLPDAGSLGMVAAVRSLLSGTPLEPAVRRFTAISSMLDALRRDAPVLISIAVRSPAPRVLAWWTKKFWPAVVKSGVQVVLVAMTDLGSDATALSEAADQVIRLGPLEKGAVRARLIEVAGHLPHDELGTYAEEISRNPSLLDSFSRLLPLTLHSETSPLGRERGETNR